MKKKQNYETPDLEVIELKIQGILCESNPGGSDPLNPGGGI